MVMSERGALSSSNEERRCNIHIMMCIVLEIAEGLEITKKTD